MPKVLTTPELALSSRPPGVTLTRWLYDEIRNAILDGRLNRGTRLPATRDFSLQYSVSRRVVVNVFEQLQAEGYLVSRVGSGTCVSDELPEELLEAPSVSSEMVKPRASPRVLPEWVRPARPFRPIEPALSNFPADVWARVAARRLRRVSPSLLAGGAVPRVMRPCAKRSLTTWEFHEVSIARPMRWSLYQESSKRWTWLRGS